MKYYNIFYKNKGQILMGTGRRKDKWAQCLMFINNQNKSYSVSVMVYVKRTVIMRLYIKIIEYI